MVKMMIETTRRCTRRHDFFSFSRSSNAFRIDRTFTVPPRLPARFAMEADHFKRIIRKSGIT